MEIKIMQINIKSDNQKNTLLKLTNNSNIFINGKNHLI
jgi:hypothetical protein